MISNVCQVNYWGSRMSELTSLFGIISEGKKQAEIEKAEKIRIEEEGEGRRQG